MKLEQKTYYSFNLIKNNFIIIETLKIYYNQIFF